MLNFKHYFVMICLVALSACGGRTPVKPDSAASPTPSPTRQSDAQPGNGGYYLDDGPDESARIDIHSIPDAEPKAETPYPRSNKPYIALGQKYVPMTSYVPYQKQGTASWYGKRYHGKQTSSGEIYDMYGMSAAHTTLPIPSYVKVTNPANNRAIVVRVNDRGPFKKERLIDLSYAAAHKLDLITPGSGTVIVEAIDTSPDGLKKFAQSKKTITAENSPSSAANPVSTNPTAQTEKGNARPEISRTDFSVFYVQAGAFKNEQNGDALRKKIIALNLASDTSVTNVYNGDLYRVRLGPFTNRRDADIQANRVRKQLNISVLVTNQ
ncbi:MAG: septal ring lytic transglycosylase RlpA family lipoprotein [Betaproteobacteria bacterium HGW-Betaproteobacteria-22]|nr:MAG: septal ring lytic transglycosylase RlpA family lipoprotein [Betaproteobacteria bacterium HGW-Betaproteobacteria-22]